VKVTVEPSAEAVPVFCGRLGQPGGHNRFRRLSRGQQPAASPRSSQPMWRATRA
jgi:hypothetical protein